MPSPTRNERRNAVHRGDSVEKTVAARFPGAVRAGGSQKYRRVADVVLTIAGHPCVGECKSRKSLPKSITNALAQAREYDASGSSIPLAFVREKGGRVLVVADLEDFCTLTGTTTAPELPAKPRRVRVTVGPVQIDLFAHDTGGHPTTG